MPPRIISNTPGCAGLIPFLATGSLALADSDLPDFDPLQCFVSYGALVLSILGVVLWGRVLSQSAQASSRWAQLMA
ncbi:MAG: DUF3429 domain-containing protein [Pseudomonadales bacterium]|nr:DUF3429 domain-containing protein [Pseudomonadales bacterium]